MLKKPLQKPKSLNKKTFAIQALRRASYRWPLRYAAVKAVHIARNQYVCAVCKLIHPRKNIQIDHIEPVVDPLIGWAGWDSYIDRLFCDTSNLQAICRPCHDEKTGRERLIRKAAKTKNEDDEDPTD